MVFNLVKYAFFIGALTATLNHKPDEDSSRLTWVVYEHVTKPIQKKVLKWKIKKLDTLEEKVKESKKFMEQSYDETKR